MEAADFIAARERAENPPAINDAARNLERLERFRSEGAGLPAPAADPQALWTNLSEAEPQPPADDPVDRTVSLEQAEHDAAMRRYFRWKYPPEEGEGSAE